MSLSAFRHQCSSSQPSSTGHRLIAIKCTYHSYSSVLFLFFNNLLFADIDINRNIKFVDLLNCAKYCTSISEIVKVLNDTLLWHMISFLLILPFVNQQICVVQIFLSSIQIRTGRIKRNRKL